MNPHRFDPFSFVVGLATAVFAIMLLWGDLDVPDLRPSRLWPLPVFALGLMLTLYGVRRLVESTRGAHTIEPEAPDDADAIEVGSDTEVFDQD
jgi:hypothetical protein